MRTVIFSHPLFSPWPIWLWLRIPVKPWIIWLTYYGHKKAESLILNLNLGDLDIKAKFFVEIKFINKKWAKWVLINWPKIPPKTQNLSAQIVCSSQKVCNCDEKKLHRASVILDLTCAPKFDVQSMIKL